MENNSYIAFRISDELRRKVEDRAQAAGLDLSNFCRAVMTNIANDQVEVKI